MEKKIRVAIANDHTAFEFRKPIIEYLKKNGYQLLDLGTANSKPVDYPDYGFKIARAISDGKADVGIAICGTGIGISIAANRVPGIRCALTCNEETAKLAREHNNANVIALGSRVITSDQAVELVKIFLDTPTSAEERHHLRIKKLN